MNLFDDSKLHFIAEFNTSHFGDIGLAKEMIELVKECGANCVKFQSWTAETLYSKSYYLQNPIAKRFVKKYSLSEKQLLELARHCEKVGIDFLSTPYSIREAKFLINDCGSKVIKIASMELNNLAYLSEIAALDADIILSTGMSDLCEIKVAVESILERSNYNLCLLHCVSQYPTELENANILNVKLLKDVFTDLLVGYSDHTLGYEAALASVVLGARVIERHFTFDKTRIGMDNHMASEPPEFRELVQRCHNVMQALGSYDRIITKEDIDQRSNMRRSVVYQRDLSAGHVLKAEDLTFKRPGTGIPPTEANEIIGKLLVTSVEADVLVDLNHFNKND